jgi:hypothetical protein
MRNNFLFEDLKKDIEFQAKLVIKIKAMGGLMYA